MQSVNGMGHHIWLIPQPPFIYTLSFAIIGPVMCLVVKHWKHSKKCPKISCA